MKKPLVLGKYLLLERVNIGGMAEVFIAKTFGVGGFEQILAVKKILPTMAEDEEFIKMFIDEARVSVQLNHPNIVHIHDLDGKDDTYYIVMEYVSGRDLRSVLERFRRRKERMPIPMAAYIASKMCAGLDHAHRKKDVKGMELHIVHRDVSPQNILLSYEGGVKLIDFGIARTAIRSTKTEVGMIKGKFGYMSPEQAFGLPVDRRSDVFAAAVILYEMLTGEKLFSAESDYSTLEKVRKTEFRPPREVNADISPALEKVLLRALSRDMEKRYQWASEFHEALEEFIVGEEGSFSEKQLSSILKEMFADEYTRETNKLRHYGELVASDALLPEEVAALQEAAAFRRGTPSGRKRVAPRSEVLEADSTQVVCVPGAPEEEASVRGPDSGGFRAVSENPAPIQLLKNAPVYVGDTVVGREAANMFAQTAQLPKGVETAQSAVAAVETGELSAADVKPQPATDRVRLRPWLYAGLGLAGLLSVVALSVSRGTPPSGGRLVAVSTPANIPLEIRVKGDLVSHAQRFVSKNSAIVLPADTYQVEINSLDENHRVRNEHIGPLSLRILAGEDHFLSVQLEPKVHKLPEGEAQQANVQGVDTPTAPGSEGSQEDEKGESAAAGTVAQALSGSPTGASAALPAETFVLSLGGLSSGTQVLLGGKSRGTTPALKELVLPMQGTHRIELRRPGFEKVTKTIQNTARERTVNLNVDMRPEKPPPGRTPPSTLSKKRTEGKLVISTIPNDAEIWVNGKNTGKRTPRGFGNPLSLEEGSHTLVFKAGGKQSKPIMVEITSENATVPASLRGITLE